LHSQFRDGRELVDDKRGGHPKSNGTEVNIAAVADLVKYDRQIASRMITESLNIPKTVILRILKEDLGKRELCAHFVPHSLTPEEREDRASSSSSFSSSSSSGPGAYAPDAPQPCRLIVLPSYYSSVLDVPTFATSPSSLSVQPERPLVVKGGTAWARIMASNFA